MFKVLNAIYSKFKMYPPKDRLAVCNRDRNIYYKLELSFYKNNFSDRIKLIIEVQG